MKDVVVHDYEFTMIIVYSCVIYDQIYDVQTPIGGLLGLRRDEGRGKLR